MVGSINCEMIIRILFFLFNLFFPLDISSMQKTSKFSLLSKLPINFDACMNIKRLPYHKKYGEGYNKEAITKLKILYEQNHFLKIERSAAPKIPNIIHQIWVGAKPIPKILRDFAKTWQAFHPGWEYKLWTNDFVESVLMQMIPEHRVLYSELQDPRAKADLLRYYILYLYGGLYVDADFKCLALFEGLHHYYDFYTGISSHANDEVINNALIGARKNHPILKIIIDNIKCVTYQNWMSSLGVFYYSKMVVENVTVASGCNIALPVNILYPVPYNYNRQIPLNHFIKPETMAIHYWAHSSNVDWNNKNDWN